MKNTVYWINGPVVKLKDAENFQMLEMVFVGSNRLLGEVISIDDTYTTIQVYESTTGLKVGEPVVGSGSLLSVTLGPGLLSNIFDGIERPLRSMADEFGAFVQPGSDLPSLDEEKFWDTEMLLNAGDKVTGGERFGYTQESLHIKHYFLIPPHISGIVEEVKPNGQYQINDTLIVIRDKYNNLHSCTMVQKWPIRKNRPIRSRVMNSRPLITGQRVIDTFFPLSKGGSAAIPGGFGAGKTMLQHQLAKWCDADIIVYIGCGERGNEMTQVLEEFSELIDPKTNRPLTDRTILIANTSNMPVAAREASIYTGITLAEYYRDMGYHVALMADSTSRWAEALREISGRLEEMPAEEGFPAYLPSRISEFYERAGYVQTLCNQEGSVSIIGAVSPQGADFSEPVTQNTKRFVRAFWALDKNLAYARHFPAVNYTLSYSEYLDELKRWFETNVNRRFMVLRASLVNLLNEETKLMEIVKLIGSDVLADEQKLILEIARVIRVGFLQQNAFHPEDTYVPLEKQYLMMDIIMFLYDSCYKLVLEKKTVDAMTKTGIFEDVIKVKYDIPNNELHLFDALKQQITDKLSTVA